MSRRLHEARHRAAHKAPSKPRRLISGLALPTSAAVALIFGAAGAAVATSPGTQSVAFGRNGGRMNSPQPSTVQPATLRARPVGEIEQAQAVSGASRTKAIEHDLAVSHASRTKAIEHDLAVSRATSVARGVERKKLAAQAVGARRATLVHSWRLPISKPVVSSGFGYRWGRLHAGQDYAVSQGTPLVSMSTGTVIFAGVQGGYGNLVKVRYWDGTVSFYGHMSSISVTSGQTVAPGTVVGRSGNTGHSTGPHLHLEMHPRGGEPVNPASWLASHNVAR